jgi:hypothetical protein
MARVLVVPAVVGVSGWRAVAGVFIVLAVFGVSRCRAVARVPVVLFVGLWAVVRASGVVGADRGMARLAARVRAGGALAPVAELVHTVRHGLFVRAARVVPDVRDRAGAVHIDAYHARQATQRPFDRFQFRAAEAVSERHFEHCRLRVARHGSSPLTSS